MRHYRYGTIHHKGKDLWFRINNKHPITGNSEYDRAYLVTSEKSPFMITRIITLMEDKGWDYCDTRQTWKRCPEGPRTLIFAKKKLHDDNYNS